jgi:hypothetical protein
VSSATASWRSHRRPGLCQRSRQQSARRWQCCSARAGRPRLALCNRAIALRRFRCFGRLERTDALVGEGQALLQRTDEAGELGILPLEITHERGQVGRFLGGTAVCPTVRVVIGGRPSVQDYGQVGLSDR